MMSMKPNSTCDASQCLKTFDGGIPNRVRFTRRPGVLTATLTVALAGACQSSLERRFHHHIAYLASDELEGRGVGSKGLEQAGDYIAGQFKDVGLEPAGDGGTYFQSFPVTLSRKLTDAGRLAITGDAADRKQGRDFMPLSVSSDDAFSGGIAFCGYGIVNPEKKHDDFANTDLSGKVALVLDGEPAGWAGENGQPTEHASLRSKVYNVKDHGAVAILLVHPAPVEGETDVLPEFFGEGAEEYGLPAFHVSREMADKAVSSGGLGSLDALQKKLDDGAFASAELAHKDASGQAGFERRREPTRNVMGLLRGSGKLSDEFIIIGAHYDHLGVRKPMMRKFKAGRIVQESSAPEIHNGADDNASGTSGLMEIARMFTAKNHGGRGILFIAFSAEETGLLGSKYFVEHPTVPLDRVAVMLNMDMIGRLVERGNKAGGTGTAVARTDPPARGFQPAGSALQVFGVDSDAELGKVVETQAAILNLPIAPGVDVGGRSDHASFVRKKIPSLHFFSGSHVDYHKPSDDTEKINVVGGAKVTRFVYAVAESLATLEPRPAFVEVKPKSEPSPGGKMTTFRVVMGLSPNYADDGQPGMGVDAVSPDGPADLAGIMAGDRILRINGKIIANVYDYMASTRGNKAGDEVEVVVLREGKEIPLKVTLAGAK